MDLLKQYYPSDRMAVADIELTQPILTIKSIKEEQLENRFKGTTEAKPVMYFAEDNRSLVLSVGRVRQLQGLFGLDSTQYPGKRVQLYVGDIRGMQSIMFREAAPQASAQPPSLQVHQGAQTQQQAPQAPQQPAAEAVNPYQPQGQGQEQNKSEDLPF